MYSDNNNSYTLSAMDLAIMQQAHADFNEITRSKPKYMGLPPLWSKLPYLMLQRGPLEPTKFFWMEYRKFNDLLENRDQHYYHAHIPKNSGGTRTLTVPDHNLQYHQYFILHNILYKIPVSEHACAYHRYRGLTDLAAPHVGHDTLIHIDIQDFFSSITEQTVFETLLEETGYPKSVAGFLSHLCCYRNYLPQGACTSPALSNLCFKKCDEQIAMMARQHKLAYTRYSDDIYLSGNGVQAANVIAEVKNILQAHGFQINKAKTKVLGPHQAQKVTAIVVNEKMQVSQAYRRQLRQQLHYLKLYGPNAKHAREADSYLSYLNRLLGQIGFVLYVDPSNREFRDAQTLVQRLLYNIQ